jgi:YVTN family beta-propeller protein
MILRDRKETWICRDNEMSNPQPLTNDRASGRHKWTVASCAAAAVWSLSGAALWAAAQAGAMSQTVAAPPVLATLPNGRQITPLGDWITVAPFPFSLALRSDGEQMVVPSLGFPFALNVIDRPASPGHRVKQIPQGYLSKPETEVYTGVAFAPDGELLYVATGDSGAIDVLEAVDWHKVARIELNGGVGGHLYNESFGAALVLSSDGRRLYAIDEANWRVVVIDTATHERIASLATGVNPIALCLSPDNRHLYIANSGLFEYRTISGADKDDRLHTGLHFPPFGYPSPAAQGGTTAEGKSIPGLGSANDPRGSSLWTYDLSDPGNPRLSASLRLGATIDSSKNDVVGGAAPSALTAGASSVYVALAHEDAVAVVNAEGNSLQAQISLTPFTGPDFADNRGNPLRGVMPSGLALANNRLYVAEAGINALAVIDTSGNRVLGHLPVGWSPSAVLVSADDNTLYVANSKGKGSGPNAGSSFNPATHGSYIGELELGSLSVIPASLAAHPEQWTETVIRDNRAETESGVLPRLKHVLLIIRENRTFDDVFGDLAGADGDPLLAHFGMHGKVENNPAMQDLQVTPNAHAMAALFATSDRYFTDSDVSVDGHRWAIGIAPTPWMAMAWPSTYGGRRHGNPFSETPGRRALGGATDGPMPEDEPEFGSLWEHVDQSGLKVLNYGESLELEGMDEMEGSEPEGQRLFLNAPLPRPVFAATDHNFATANMGIPDTVRAEEFMRNFSARLKTSDDIPSMIVMRLGNDHTAGPRPADGYPLRESYVADNDLALGQILDFLSHQSIWRDTAVFVTEDDPQSGVDHVDAHRSILLVMGPWVRGGFLSHRHSSMGSIQKTIYELLGIGPLNLEDALAADLSDMFTDKPNISPYTALPVDPRVFVPSNARIARPKTAKQKADLSDIDDSQKIRKSFAKQKAASTTAGQTATPANPQ